MSVLPAIFDDDAIVLDGDASETIRQLTGIERWREQSLVRLLDAAYERGRQSAFSEVNGLLHQRRL